MPIRHTLHPVGVVQSQETSQGKGTSQGCIVALLTLKSWIGLLLWSRHAYQSVWYVRSCPVFKKVNRARTWKQDYCLWFRSHHNKTDWHCRTPPYETQITDLRKKREDTIYRWQIPQQSCDTTVTSLFIPSKKGVGAREVLLKNKDIMYFLLVPPLFRKGGVSVCSLGQASECPKLNSEKIFVL